MAYHKSAEKRHRQTIKRTLVNRSRISRIRTYIKNVELAVNSGDVEAAQSAFRAAQPEIQRGVTKGVLHKNTAARRISRLALRLRVLVSA